MFFFSITGNVTCTSTASLGLSSTLCSPEPSITDSKPHPLSSVLLSFPLLPPPAFPHLDVTSILVKSTKSRYLTANLPWLAGSGLFVLFPFPSLPFSLHINLFLSRSRATPEKRLPDLVLRLSFCLLACLLAFLR
jgi:hypothetical protein